MRELRTRYLQAQSSVLSRRSRSAFFVPYGARTVGHRNVRLFQRDLEIMHRDACIVRSSWDMEKNQKMKGGRHANREPWRTGEEREDEEEQPKK